MMRILVSLTALVLFSCKNANLKVYKQIAQKADKFEIFYRIANTTVIIPDQEVAAFRNVLARNVEPEFQRKIVGDTRINFYKSGERIAYPLIHDDDENAFVNFSSNNVNFGFRLTYELGQTLSTLYPSRGHK